MKDREMMKINEWFVPQDLKVQHWSTGELGGGGGRRVGCLRLSLWKGLAYRNDKI